jgi:hypothetical protein
MSTTSMLMIALAVAVVLLVTAALIILRGKNKAPKELETHVHKQCASCGWEGSVSKYHKKCSNCGETLY